jgi:hypothetical protein
MKNEYFNVFGYEIQFPSIALQKRINNEIGTARWHGKSSQSKIPANPLADGVADAQYLFAVSLVVERAHREGFSRRKLVVSTQIGCLLTPEKQMM